MGFYREVDRVEGHSALKCYDFRENRPNIEMAADVAISRHYVRFTLFRLATLR
jgi:hypothetical protein